MKVSSNGKVRRSEKEWREIFAKFAKSGLNRREFCHKEKINLNSFQRWNGRLGVPRQSEFIDVTRFIDWLQARLKENIFRALAVNPKIPFTDSGIQAIVSEVEGVLRRGVTLGGINPDEPITVTAPLASEVDANTKASRLLPDIRFIAVLAGAIHKVQVRGTVTV